jgi:DNA-binding transcriptional MerR regulator
MPRTYSLSEVQAFTGASLSNLQHWTSTGLIVADDKTPRGSGRHRQYSFRNLVEVAIAVDAHAAGLQSAGIGVILDRWRNLVSDESARKWSRNKVLEVAELTEADFEDHGRPMTHAASTEEIADYIDRMRLVWRQALEGFHDPGYVGGRGSRGRAIAFVITLLRSKSKGPRYRVATFLGELEDVGISYHLFERMTFVIRLDLILADLEQATGDSWPVAER